MKKKVLPLIAVLSLLSSCAPFKVDPISTSSSSVTSSEKEISKFSYRILEDDSIEITGINEESGSMITIPSLFEGRKVSSVAKGAFKNNKSLVTVKIEEGVTFIKEECFSNCVNLKDVVLPNSVISIGDRAFESCSSLEAINITDSIISLGNYAFSSCSSLKEIHLPDNSSFIKVPNFLFAYCYSLENVTLPNRVKAIGRQAFFSCTSLVNIIFPEAVETIENSAFANCSSLSSVSFNETLKKVEDSAFSNCQKIKELSLPIDTVYSPNAFSKCNIDRLNLSSNITSLSKENASSYLSCISSDSLSLLIPGSVSEIDLTLFDEYSSITDIEIEESSAYYSSVDGIIYNKDKTVLLRCPRGKKEISLIPDTVTSISKGAFLNCDKLTNISLPKSVQNIHQSAFENCSSLLSIVIPIGVLKVERAFMGCTSLNNINCEAPLKPFDWTTDWNNVSASKSISPRWNFMQNSVLIQGVYYTLEDEEKNSLVISGYEIEDIKTDCSLAQEAQVYGVSYPVTEIKKGAFASCSKIRTVQFSKSIVTVNEHVFDDCYMLEALIISENITTFLSDFSGCLKLKNLYLRHASLPEGFKEDFNRIDSSTSAEVFFNFVPKKSVYDGVEYIFSDDTNNYEVSIYVPDKSVIQSNFTTLRSSVTFDGVDYTVTKMLDDCFSGASRLANLTIPDSIKYIGDGALRGTKISSISLPTSLVSLGNNVFDDCSSLREIKAKNINSGFSDSNGILFKIEDGKKKLLRCPENYPSSVTITGDVTEIDAGAFKNCKNISTVLILSEQITEIKESTFENCIYLSGITLPDSIQSIGENAFKGCSSSLFTEINIPSSVSSIDQTAFDLMTSLENIYVSSLNDNYCDYQGSLYLKEKDDNDNEIMRNLLRVPEGKTGTVEFSKDLVTIDKHALYKCSKIEKYQISEDSLNYYTSPTLGYLYNKSIDTLLSVPQGNSNTVRFEATTTKIDKDAFVDCDKISYVIFTESITDIDPETFKGMANIDTISPNSMILNDLDIYFELNNIHTISLQDDLDATYFLAGIDKEGTPEGTSKDYIYALPDDLSIVISSNNKRYTNIDGVIYSKDSALKAIYRVLKSVQGDFVIPNDVNIISVNAFKNNQLTSVYIPDSVTHIKAEAFTLNPDLLIKIQKNSKDEFAEIADNWTDVDESLISWGVALDS